MIFNGYRYKSPCSGGKKRKNIKKIEGSLWNYRVKYLAKQGVRLSVLQDLRLVECDVLVGERPVGVTMFRIFHPAAIRYKGVTINDYQSLDSHPELVLYEGYYQNMQGQAVNIQIKKKQGEESGSAGEDDNCNRAC